MDSYLLFTPDPGTGTPTVVSGRESRRPDLCVSRPPRGMGTGVCKDGGGWGLWSPRSMRPQGVFQKYHRGSDYGRNVSGFSH